MKLSNGLALNGHPSGRHFLQIPGPSTVPDRILRAMDYPTIDHRGPEFQNLGKSVLSGIRKIFQTESHVVIYPASGTGAWEAALTNTLSPGDLVLMVETGHFATLWKRMAERLGIVVDFVAGDWRRGVDPEIVEQRLAADPGRRYKAVCVVHNETSTGVTSRIAEVRRAIDRAGHPALLLVDSISGLASADYRHDEWGVDVTVSGSQKGLMLPPGLSFNAISAKALEASKTAKLPRAYWEWNEMIASNANGFFPSTPATNLLYGLHEAIAMLLEEGLPNVFARHRRHAAATRAAVHAWGLEVLCANPDEYSPVLTGVLMPDGHNADAFRKIALEKFNLSLGQGLGKVAGKVFRIGHLGDFNDLTLMATLSGIEMTLALAGVPHRKGGVLAAMSSLSGSTDHSSSEADRAVAQLA
ncbi:MAG: aminotransferase class V-fold PLP-dependent enzyme [Limnobacter sp.]|nr:aminotransferase class V-fold PLP-dependent enzyme [Limnobacter sp.]